MLFRSAGYAGATVAVMLGNLYGSRLLDGAVTSNYWILTIKRFLSVLTFLRLRLIFVFFQTPKIIPFAFTNFTGFAAVGLAGVLRESPSLKTGVFSCVSP